MRPRKERIRDNFSKSAANYDQYAHLQKKMSDFIFKLITKDHEKILDIGCGTGLLIGKIAEKYPNQK